MACDPSEILELAKELSESSNEAKLRASIGRSYYCAFHSCLNNLEITNTREWTGGSGGVHQKLIDTYLYSGNKAIGYMLQSLKVKRHLADYDLSESVTPNDAKSAIASVKLLLSKIS